jgi:XTP/dITP diphosphohydrolase
VHTKYYAGPTATDHENNTKLLRELADLPIERRGARYVCALALALQDEGEPGGLQLIVRRGTTRGRITFEPRGSGGFGYDPLFEPARERAGGRTFGQYAADEKDAISHRGRAARRMRSVLLALGF